MMRLAMLAGAIASLTLLGYAAGAAGLTAQDLRHWILAYAGFAPLMFIAVFATLNTIGVPLPILATAGGTAFGPAAGAAAVLSAICVTACVQFLLARHLAGTRLRDRISARLGRFAPVLERRGVLAVAGGRLLPGPFSELNMAAGLTPIAFRDFALGTFLGCAPKALAWSAVGATLA